MIAKKYDNPCEGKENEMTKYKTEDERRKAQNRAKDEYHKKAMTGISVRLHNESDAAVIEFLKSLGNKAEFIRWAVRKAKEEGYEEATEIIKG